jgi:hypothetical protein
VSYQEEALKHDRNLFPKKENNLLGISTMGDHEAKRLLRKDVQEGKQTTMEPKALHQTKDEYCLDFPLHVFRKHTYQEEYAQNWPLLLDEQTNKKRSKEEVCQKGK